MPGGKHTQQGGNAQRAWRKIRQLARAGNLEFVFGVLMPLAIGFGLLVQPILDVTGWRIHDWKPRAIGLHDVVGPLVGAAILGSWGWFIRR